METKKSDKANLDKKRSIFLGLGFCLSLIFVTVAFEWRSYEPRDILNLGSNEDDFDDQLEIPLTQQPPPPPPPPVVPPEIIEVPDEEEIDEEVLDIDIEFDEEAQIEELVYEEPEEEIDEIFNFVESPPSPEGGLGAFHAYLKKNLRYPRQAARMGIEGKVLLRFVVERDGTLTDIVMLKGIGAGCDEEALRTLKDCPIKWNPGKQRGRPVRTRFTLPIHFRLSK